MEELINYSCPWQEEIQYAQDGAKLENIELSEEPSVIPEGALHKNKNNIDLDITKKGIPVVTVDDDSAETFEEIKEQEDSLVQHAEIEHNEVIFSKELTDFLESARKEWNDKDQKDSELLLEVGKRLTKELLENTNDNTGLVDKLALKLEDGGVLFAQLGNRMLTADLLRNTFNAKFTDQLVKNINALYNYLKYKKGWSDRNIYAIMGNIMQENSKWDPFLVNLNGGATGYFQFKGDTLTDYNKWKAETGHEGGGLTQATYIEYMINNPDKVDKRYKDYLRAVELSKSSNAVDRKNGQDYLNKLSSTQYWIKDFAPAWNGTEMSLDDITDLFANTFEKAGKDLNLEQRRKYANQFLQLYSAFNN